jgi:hypothetical protein
VNNKQKLRENNAVKLDKEARESYDSDKDTYIGSVNELMALETNKADNKIRFAIVMIVGCVLVTLVAAGLLVALLSDKDCMAYWQSILPIISASIAGMLGYAVGERISSKNGS